MAKRYDLTLLLLPHLTDTDTVTVFRDDKSHPQGVRFLTVTVDKSLDVVVEALDEDGFPIPLTPDEEAFAIRMVNLGYHE